MGINILKSTGYKGRMEPNLHFRGAGVYLGGCVCYARGLLSRTMSREIRVLWQNSTTHAVRQTSTNQFEFRYQARDATIVYTYSPRAGTLSEITASVNGGASFRPMRKVCK